MKSIFAFALLFALSAVISAQKHGIDFQSEDWKEASELARKENKLIFIDGYTTWCAPCKIMEEHVFTHKSCGDLYNSQFINMRMNMEQKEGPLFVARYGVGIYPIFLYLAWDGTLIHKIEGYRNIHDMVVEGNKALEPYRFKRALEDRFKGGDRMPDFLYHYTYYKKAANDESYREIIPLYLESKADWQNEQSAGYIFEFVDSFDSDMFRFMARNKPLFRKVAGKDAFESRFSKLVKAEIHNGGDSLTLEKRESVIQQAYPESADLMNLQYRLNYYKKTANELEYARHLFTYIINYTPEDLPAIKDNLELFKDHLLTGDTKDQVMAWVKAVAKEKNDADSWMNYARFLLEMDQAEEALRITQRAVNLAKAEGKKAKPYKKEYKAIKKILKGKKSSS